MNYHVNEIINFYQFPLVSEQHAVAPGSQLSLGDLNGNAMKLMFMLIRHGIVSNINEQDYQELVSIYQTHVNDITHYQLVKFNYILRHLRFVQYPHFQDWPLIRLSGDELANCGANDYFTLMIIKTLVQNNVRVEILASKHNLHFIEIYEKKLDFSSSRFSFEQAKSMVSLQRLIDRKLVRGGEIRRMIKKWYKPNLLAISYALSKDTDAQEISVFSYGHITTDTIGHLAKKMQVNFEDETAALLAKTIDNINIKFQTYINPYQIHSLYQPPLRFWSGASRTLPVDTAIELILWNRASRASMNVTPKFYLMNAPQGPEITPVFPSTVAPHDQGLGRAPNANGELNSYRYATHVETNSMEKLSLGEEVLALLRAGSRPLFMSKSLLDKYASPRNSPQTTVRDESPQSVEEEGLENSAANKLN